MLSVYIDETGETGAFVAREHSRYNTSPAFGYASFVVPADKARTFSKRLTQEKRILFRSEIDAPEHPERWECKGAEIFRPHTPERFQQQLRVFNGLVNTVRQLGGALFYSAARKPLGTPKQTDLNTTDREALSQLARHADHHDSNIMVMIDQINEKTREQRLAAMYGHILGRASDYPEMRRIIEPPMHVDSVLSANIEFADWIAACVTRAIEYQLIANSPYGWIATTRTLDGVRASSTHESKLHLWKRALPDLNHSDVFRRERCVHPTAEGQLLSVGVDPAIFRRIKAAAERAQP